MPYRLDPSFHPGQQLRRAIAEQVNGAMDALTAQTPPSPEAIHDARKHCKKARSALRLARKALGDTYDRENAALRDAARHLSEMRDAIVIAQTLDKLLDHAPALRDHQPTAHLHKVLRRRAEEHTPDAADTSHGERVTQALRLLRDSAERLGVLHIPDDGKLLPTHWRRTLRRAKRAIKQAKDDPTDDNMHTARKRIKDYWYHARLLQPFAAKRMKASRKQAKTLADLLGDHHDLAVLRAAVLNQQLPLVDAAPLLGAIDARQQTLAQDIFDRARDLLKHSVSPKKLKPKS